LAIRSGSRGAIRWARWQFQRVGSNILPVIKMRRVTTRLARIIL
jgi:hypothetical protein